MPKILKAEGIETDSIGSNGNNYFDLQRNRSTLVRLSTSDLVGIGTTTPAYKFTVQSSSGTSPQIGILSESQTIDNGSEMTMDLRNTSGFFSGGSIRVRHTVGSQTAGSENTYMSFLTRNTGTLAEKMRIDAGGNIGIGTTSFTEKLTVSGGVHILATNKLSFTSTANQTTIHAPASNTIAFTTDSSERVRIDSSGNVGVGTASPSVKLEVAGSTRIGSGNDYQFDSTLKINAESTGATGYLRFYTDSTERLRIDSSGNVGIGTSTITSSYILDARGWIRSQHPAGDAAIAIIAGNTTGVSDLYFGDSASDTVGSIRYNHTSNFLSITTNSVERVRINSSGNLLIGATTAESTLIAANRGFAQINGTTDCVFAFTSNNVLGGYIYNASNEFRVANYSNNPLTLFTNNAERVRVTAAGNLGVGTNNPSTLLHVNGVITHSAGTIGSNANGTRTVTTTTSTPTGGSDGDIVYVI